MVVPTLMPMIRDFSAMIDAHHSTPLSEQVMDSIEAQSQAGKTTFPSHLLDLVVSLRAYLRDDTQMHICGEWFFCSFGCSWSVDCLS